jgi:predicted GNAT family acetyltransferase
MQKQQQPMASQPTMMAQPQKYKACECSLDGKKKADAIKKFLTNYGDSLPPEEIKKAIKNLDNWSVLCDCDDKNKVISLGRYEKNDWYLCTFKNAATHPDYRGKGLATQITGKVFDNAMADSCLVLAADVTATNKPSLRTLEKYGFKPVNEFCWGEGEEPAQILHLVKYTPIDGKSCKIARGRQ